MVLNGDIIVVGFIESFGVGNYDVWVFCIFFDGYFFFEGIRNLGFYVSDSNVIVGVMNVILFSYILIFYDMSVLEKFINVIF